MLISTFYFILVNNSFNFHIRQLILPSSLLDVVSAVFVSVVDSLKKTNLRPSYYFVTQYINLRLDKERNKI